MKPVIESDALAPGEPYMNHSSHSLDMARLWKVRYTTARAALSLASANRDAALSDLHHAVLNAGHEEGWPASLEGAWLQAASAAAHEEQQLHRVLVERQMGMG